MRWKSRPAPVSGSRLSIASLIGWRNPSRSTIERTLRGRETSTRLSRFSPTIQKTRSRAVSGSCREAHKLVNARRGTVPATGNENPPTKGRPAPRKPDLKAVPKTLAHVPGSDGPGDVSDEFGNVDALDGLDLESAIARMTPAQRGEVRPCRIATEGRR